nr:MAG TPA: hypothetical protein [Caudoviricetes sp.]
MTIWRHGRVDRRRRIGLYSRWKAYCHMASAGEDDVAWEWTIHR